MSQTQMVISHYEAESHKAGGVISFPLHSKADTSYLKELLVSSYNARFTADNYISENVKIVWWDFICISRRPSPEVPLRRKQHWSAVM